MGVIITWIITPRHLPVVGYPPLGPRRPRDLHEFVIVLSRNICDEWSYLIA
ncbi:unnamed protein product [Musa acuminata subsp. malaccensis]|uniref:(wild Malaysian banana) hypothetical protein n=1 Tax=Musa acuminata subsp. malaccensis TaxID=214687 RepID=A0A804J734_MUSAM|nr:unnamed protein product [Musa acuminata subsp. malaccensis]